MKKIILTICGVLAVILGGFYFSGGGGDFLKDGAATIVIQSASSSVVDDASMASSSDPIFVAGGLEKASKSKKSGLKPGAAASKNIAEAAKSPASASDPTDARPVIGDSYLAASSPADGGSSNGVLQTETVKNNPPQQCSLSNIGNPSRQMILNEIAWMGSPAQNGETQAKASEREWIELKNISAGAVDISGWQILDSTGNLKIILGNGASGGGASSTAVSGAAKIPVGGFYLVVRGGAAIPAGATTIQADAGYTGSLSNSGDKLVLFDPNCGTSDLLDASSGWPGGDNTTKQTLERDSDGIGLHTSAAPGGSPRAENSVPTPTSTAQQPSSQFLISVSLIGAGTGAVSSSPSGILCGFTCLASYTTGTKLTFSATPAQGSFFKEWSGACGGSANCSFIVSSSVAVIAEFEPVEIPTVTVATSSTSQSSDSESSSTTLGHLVIAAVQIAGASSSNDFIKIFNPTATAVDVGGWKLHKKSSTGTDYSLRTFSGGSLVAPGAYFTWANSSGGFADSIGANVSSTETLSADNSAALFDENGTIIDQVAWGTGSNQYGEGAAYPTNPIANQVLARKTENGLVVDTGDNASDFLIQ